MGLWAGRAATCHRLAHRAFFAHGRRCPPRRKFIPLLSGLCPDFMRPLRAGCNIRRVQTLPLGRRARLSPLTWPCKFKNASLSIPRRRRAHEGPDYASSRRRRCRYHRRNRANRGRRQRPPAQAASRQRSQPLLRQGRGRRRRFCGTLLPWIARIAPLKSSGRNPSTRRAV